MRKLIEERQVREPKCVGKVLFPNAVCQILRFALFSLYIFYMLSTIYSLFCKWN